MELLNYRRREGRTQFPRVEGYRQAIRNRVTVDWATVPTLRLDPTSIPPEVQVKAALADTQVWEQSAAYFIDMIESPNKVNEAIEAVEAYF